ncbi:MAG: glycosyltransferase family 4 protein [Chloroflexota bacterium]
MRLALIGPFGFHPNKTMHSRALGLARPLVEFGHQVAIFMPPWQTPDEANQSWQEEGVTIHYTPLSGGMVGTTHHLLRATLTWQPDLVHCFKPKAYSGLAAWWLWQTRRHRLPLIVDTDDWEGWGGWNELAPYSPLQKRFFHRQEQWGLRHCHMVTVASRALQTLVWSLGVAPERVAYIPNGPGIDPKVEVDKAAVRQKLGLDDRPVLLLYSRLFEFDTTRLVDILVGVKTAVPRLAILSVGTGLYAADAAQFRQQLEQANLSEAIVDVGWVETAELPPILASADVGLYLMDDTLLNRTKCPVKLADMISLGIPVVAEAVGQVPEYVVNGRSGYLHPSGNNEAVIRSLVRLLQQPHERQRLSQAARAHAETFAWSRLAQQLEAVYQRI